MWRSCLWVVPRSERTCFPPALFSLFQRGVLWARVPGTELVISLEGLQEVKGSCLDSEGGVGKEDAKNSQVRDLEKKAEKKETVLR